MKKDRGLIFFTGAVIFALVFIFSGEFAAGAAKGLRLCADTVIPSLFAFICASTLTGSGEMPHIIKTAVTPLMKLFRLPPDAFPAVLLGLVGGYPVGAKAVRELCDSDRITAAQAGRLMLFCVNPGVGFSVNAVGNAMLGSEKSGLLIFASSCISSLLIGVFSSFGEKSGNTDNLSAAGSSDFGTAIVKSVSSSASAMLTVCGFVALFSGVGEVLKTVPMDERAKILLLCFAEVTGGCSAAAGKMPLPMLSGICSFGGLSVHLQVLSICDTKKGKFFFMRLIHCALSTLVCIILLEHFPVQVDAVKISTESFAANSFSAPASVSLLFLSSLIILDLDNGKKIC